MGTEIRTFTSLKDMMEYLTDQSAQYRALFDDYSQWLGSLLRSCEETQKNEGWYQKSASMQKNLRGPMKKTPETKEAAKKGGGKGKKTESSCWVQAGDVLLCSVEQGQAEVLFEAIEEIGGKIQGLDKFKSSVQQLERMGLGKNVDYIVYIKDDVPRRIVLRTKSATPEEEGFRFATDISVQAVFDGYANE